jgi:hypothetical protein
MAMERRRGQGLGSGNPKGLTLTDGLKLAIPTDQKGKLGSSVVVSVGLLIFPSLSSQGFPVTKHQGVFPVKKKMVSEANTISLRKKTVSDQRTLYYERLRKATNFLFLVFFSFLSGGLKKRLKKK